MSAGSTRQEWLTQPERSNVVALKMLVWMALHLGRGLTRWLLLYPVSLYFLVFSAGARRASADYLRRVLGRAAGFADCLRHYHSFSATVLDRIYLLNDWYDLFDIRVHDEKLTADIIARGRGCFLLGSHFGSFEVVRALARQRPGLQVSLLMYEENARKINAALKAINPAVAQKIIALGKPDSMLRLQAALERGEFVGMLGDRTLGDESRLRRPFFGEPAAFPLGAFRLAAMLRQPIVLMFGVYRGGRRYDIHFELLADFTDAPGGGRSALVEQAIGRYAERLEHYCRLAPYNWFNFYDFWH